MAVKKYPTEKVRARNLGYFGSKFHNRAPFPWRRLRAAGRPPRSALCAPPTREPMAAPDGAPSMCLMPLVTCHNVKAQLDQMAVHQEDG